MKIRNLKTGAIYESEALKHEDDQYLDYEIDVDDNCGGYTRFCVEDDNWEDITDSDHNEEAGKDGIVINYNTKLKVGDLLYTISDAELLVYKVISICIEYIDEDSGKTVKGCFTGKEMETSSYIESDLGNINVTYFTSKSMLLKSITDILRD